MPRAAAVGRGKDRRAPPLEDRRPGSSSSRDPGRRTPGRSERSRSRRGVQSALPPSRVRSTVTCWGYRRGTGRGRSPRRRRRRRTGLGTRRAERRSRTPGRIRPTWGRPRPAASDARIGARVRGVRLAAAAPPPSNSTQIDWRSGHCTVAVNHCAPGPPAASSRVLHVAPPSVESSTFEPAPATSSPPEAQIEVGHALLHDGPAGAAVRGADQRAEGRFAQRAGWTRDPHPSSALGEVDARAEAPAGSPADQVAPPSAVRAATSGDRPPCGASAKRSEPMSARPLYCCVQVAPPSVVAMIAPLPAAQPRLVLAKRDRVEAVDALLLARGFTIPTVVPPSRPAIPTTCRSRPRRARRRARRG